MLAVTSAGGIGLARGVQHSTVSAACCCVLLLQEWHIFGISTIDWRMRVLAPMNEPRSSPLEHILMAVTGVSAGQQFVLTSAQELIEEQLRVE